jgi:nucleoside-diphosphate-sugar epimerase
MAQSFTLDHQSFARPRGESPKRVLVTGAAGNIGSSFAQHSHKRYDLRLMVRQADKPERIEKIRPFGQIVTADILDLASMKEAARGVDVVLHLAANANASGTWDIALNTNMIGTYNTFVAAKSAGAKRIVFASSIHAVSGYRREVQVKSTDPVNPGDLYGVSKCFGEALARYMAEQEDLPAIVLRIGAWFDGERLDDWGMAHADLWVSPRDLNDLIEKSIDADHLKFAIFQAISDNTMKRMDISDARELVGWKPQDDAWRQIEALRALGLDEKLLSHNLKDGRQQSGLRKELGP